MGSVVVISVAVVSGIALCCSLLIWGIGSIIKEEDSAIEEIMGVLPGTNCGLCGYPGCRQFAIQLEKRKEQVGKLYCLAGGKKVALKLSELLGDDSLAITPTATEKKARIEQFKASKKKTDTA